MKIKCKVCGIVKTKFAMCKNTETHDKIFSDRMEKEFPKPKLLILDTSGSHLDAAIITPQRGDNSNK